MSDLRVALTFDAEHPSRRQCPPGAAERILALLAARQVTATFFIQGRWASAYPDVARSIARARHLVGNHSHSHAPLPHLSDRGLVTDIEEAQRSIQEVVGVDPRPWFRCPFGEGAEDARILRALADQGYRNVHWDVAVSDWEDDRQAAGVENDVVEGVLGHGDGAIVLLHTWPAPTVDAIPGIVRRLLAEGARFVSVAEVVDGR